ncbi:hypothetical protein HDU91_001660 [Kappamyces sp. JEL0680]|nr:hypothetical protein HDU91_001660 [Kappamyces sp. JEL0680]
MMHWLALGHDVVALANLYPEETEEPDSWMFQSVGHDVLPLIAECVGLPLYRQPLRGSALQTGSVYAVEKGDEVEDLYQLLALVKDRHPAITTVVTGAILSSYQRVRVEHVCARLGLTAVAPLWMQDQGLLMQDMISQQVRCRPADVKLGAVLIKVAAVGLDDGDLMKDLGQVHRKLVQLHRQYSLHICGEGGEYETVGAGLLTADDSGCPLFQKAGSDPRKRSRQALGGSVVS